MLPRIGEDGEASGMGTPRPRRSANASLARISWPGDSVNDAVFTGTESAPKRGAGLNVSAKETGDAPREPNVSSVRYLAPVPPTTSSTAGTVRTAACVDAEKRPCPEVPAKRRLSAPYDQRLTTRTSAPAGSPAR